MNANTDDDRLIRAAIAARAHAYAPYSNYPVGAAVLTGEGAIHAGCNVENASFGLTACAERVAIFTAIAAGQRDLQALAVCTEDGGPPCGACRQVLNEFAPQARIILLDASGATVRRYAKLTDLLPDAFGPGNVG